MSVVLYSTHCPNCNMLKLLLEKKGIPYVENNSIDEMLALGFTKAPILRVDDVNMDFNNAKNWIMKYDKENANEEQ